MSNRKSILSVAPAITIAFCFATSAAASMEKSEKKHSFRFQPGGFITVIGDEGRITVRSWDKNEVELLVTKRAWGKNRREALRRLEDLEVRIDHSDDRLEVRILDNYHDRDFDFWDIFDPDRWSNHGVAVDFDLVVPREVDLRLETDEGDIDVEDIEGDVNLAVDEGDIELLNITFGDIRIDVDEGDVDIRKARGRNGRLTFRSDEGRFRLKDADFEELEVDSDEGDILVGPASIRHCNLSTDEGDIEVTFDVQEGDTYRLTTDEGEIYVALPEGVDIDLDLEAEEGRIRSDFRVDIDEFDDGERVRDTIGRGGSTLEAYTSEGDIVIDRL